MIYRLILVYILIFNVTSVTAMRKAIEDGKKSLAALRESHEMLEGVREAQLNYYKDEIETLEKKLSAIRLQIPEALLMFQKSVKSVKEKMSLSYDAYEQLIKSGFSSNSDYDEHSSELTKEQNELINNLKNSDTIRVFIVHSDFVRFCKSIKRTKSKVTALEKALETNNRRNEFSQNSRLLSSIINTFEANLEAVKKQAESK